MKRIAISFGAGIVFAFGLGIAQMTNPAKVFGFLDFFGHWDPSLAVLMGSALLVDGVLFRFILKRDAPLFDAKFHLPTQTSIDTRLVSGAAIFGLGWGMSGFCPGAAIAAAPSGAGTIAVFLVAMAAGMGFFRVYEILVEIARKPQTVELPKPKTMEIAAAE